MCFSWRFVPSRVFFVSAGMVEVSPAFRSLEYGLMYMNYINGNYMDMFTVNRSVNHTWRCSSSYKWRYNHSYRGHIFPFMGVILPLARKKFEKVTAKCCLLSPSLRIRMGPGC